MPTPAPFEIDDAKSFDENCDAFLASLAVNEPELVAALKAELPKLLRGEVDQSHVWDALNAAIAGAQL